jgi:hypothetical protein
LGSAKIGAIAFGGQEPTVIDPRFGEQDSESQSGVETLFEPWENAVGLEPSLQQPPTKAFGNVAATMVSACADTV